MKPEDAAKTAFIYKEGQFNFTTVPFGLCKAGATFQRMMDMIIAGLAYEVYAWFSGRCDRLFFVSRRAFQTTD